MRKLLLLSAIFLAIPLSAQNVRYSTEFPSISTQYSPLLTANVPPNSPTLAVCSSPANATPCTNYVTTYTSSGAACPNGAQDTPDPQPSACQSTGDAQGNVGFWAPPGKYDYTVCIENSTTCYGPYTVTLGATNGSAAITVNGGSALSSPVNFENDTVIDFSNSGSNIQATINNGQVSNAMLTNDSMTINGTGCTLGGSCSPSGGGITGSGTANTFPIFTGSSAIGNSNLTAVTGPNGINYSTGGSQSIQWDASHLSFNSGVSGSSNVTIANIYNPGSGSNAGGIILQGAPTSGSAAAGSTYVYGGQNGSGSNYGAITVGGGQANGSGYIGGNILIAGGTASGGNTNGQVQLSDQSGTFTQSGGNAVETGFIQAAKFGTTHYCNSTSSPASCSSYATGFVAIPTGSSPTLVVDDTAVDANSQIFVQNDASLGSIMGITCNSTAATLAVPAYISARSTTTSFTLAYNGTISTNALCLSFQILN